MAQLHLLPRVPQSPEVKPSPRSPKPKKFDVKEGQRGGVLGASLVIPLRLGTSVFVLEYATRCRFSVSLAHPPHFTIW